MQRNIFDDLWENIAKNEIEKTIDSINRRKIKIKLKENKPTLKESTYARYQSEKYRFRKTIDIDSYDKLRIGRNEVAALFYIAFVDEANSHFFATCSDKSEILNNLKSVIIHYIAFNIACGILVSFISSDKKIDRNYRKYVEKNGIVLSKGITYKENILKMLINIQKENKLSIHMLINIFAWLESDTYNCYEIAILKKQIKNKCKG
jgi:hypothetical protein